jgi:hypothetical protein
MNKILCILLVCLLLAGCAASAPNTESPSEPIHETQATEQVNTTTESTFKFLLYTPNDNLDGFVSTEIEQDELDIIGALTEAHVLNENIVENSLIQDGMVLKLDLNSAFADLIYTQGTTGELMVMGCLVNTYLSAYGAESLILTVDGEILESGHVIYDFPMGYYE